MIWRFNSTGVKTVDVKNSKMGDILCTIRSRRIGDLWLRLADQTTSTMILNLTGSRSLEVWDIEQPDAMPAMLIAESQKLQLEIAANVDVAVNSETPGALVIADSGAYIVAKVQNGGFSDACYVSLDTWDVVPTHSVNNVRIVFTTWRFVDISQPNDKKVVITYGDWEKAEIL